MKKSNSMKGVNKKVNVTRNYIIHEISQHKMFLPSTLTKTNSRENTNLFHDCVQSTLVKILFLGIKSSFLPLPLTKGAKDLLDLS